MVSVLSSGAVDGKFEPRLGIIKLFCVALRIKTKYWFARKPDNVSEWGGMSTRELLYQRASTIKIQLCVLV